MCSPCESASLLPDHSQECQRQLQAWCSSRTCAYISIHMHLLSLPLLHRTCVCWIWSMNIWGRAVSHLAVLADTSLGRVTNTALSEPASLLGTKHLLPLDQSRGRRDLRSHLALMPVLRTMQRAEAGSLDAWLPPLSYLTGALSGSRGLWSFQAHMGQSKPDGAPPFPSGEDDCYFCSWERGIPRIFTALHPTSPSSTPQWMYFFFFGGGYFIYKIKPNFILKNQQIHVQICFIFKTCFCFLTNMQGKLACQISFSLALLEIFFHNTKKGANIVQKLFIFLPTIFTNINIYGEERKTARFVLWHSYLTQQYN